MRTCCCPRTALCAALMFVTASLASLTGCGGDTEDPTLARVGRSRLTAEEFYASIPEQHLAVLSVEDQEEALQSWVKTELFYLEGVRRGIDDEPEMARRLRQLEREIIAEACVNRMMEDVDAVDEDEARAYFDEHRSEYSLQVRLAHILVRSARDAERALAEINAGSPFETVAQSYSIDQTGPIGGDLGYVRRGEMIHELEEAAFELKVGEVSGVITSNYGYHIIKVLDRHPGAGQPSFESKRGAVMNFLTSQRRRQRFDEALAELMERTTVVVDTAALRAAARARVGGEDAEAADTTGGMAP